MLNDTNGYYVAHTTRYLLTDTNITSTTENVRFSIGPFHLFQLRFHHGVLARITFDEKS